MIPALPSSVQIGTVEYTITDDPLDWAAIEYETKTTGYYGHASITMRSSTSTRT